MKLLMLDLDETFTEASAGWSLWSDTTARFIRNHHILQDSREGLGGQVESWQGFWCWILMKLSQKLLKGDPYHLTPPPVSSGISMSFKTPGKDLEDRWSLDMVPHVRSWWNFYRHILWMSPPIWHHLKVHQECPSPPSLLEETRKAGKVLKWFLMSDLVETSYKLDKTSSQTISLIDETNCYITKQGLT